MNLLYENRDEMNKKFITEVCNSIISQPIEDKLESNEFSAIFIEGRERQVNTLEDFAALYSFKAFSKYNYPVYCFVHNCDNFLNQNTEWIIKNRIILIQIIKIDSLEKYSKFWTDDIVFDLPDNIEKIITLQPDGMLLKSGWEDFINKYDFDWISPHWRHFARIDGNIHGQWYPFNSPSVCIGGGGFSFRKLSKLRQISQKYNKMILREYGRNDNRPPMEDLFFSFFGFNSRLFKIPTLKQCDEFACDPLTLDIWNNKEKWPFGFHYFKTVSEFSSCHHE